MATPGLRLINTVRGVQKSYVGFPHYSLLSGSFFDGSLLKAARNKVSSLTGTGVLKQIVTNAGVLNAQVANRTGSIGGPESSGFAVKFGPGGTPGFYGIVPKTVVSTDVSPHFAVKVT